MEYLLVAAVLVAVNAFLWALNKRVDALPANTAHEESWLKDEPILAHGVVKG